ncbi:MAG: rod shape-determining protein MreD [Spirulinaceae cyanobacterium SM2_1_0]|nr:rod shape-determining protein MreD [Spirulinaceae cyanobacterium SM2_1_0]
MLRLFEFSPRLRRLCDWLVVVASVLLCLLILPARLPGAELLGIRPNWLLIWVVVWSVKRTAWQGAIAGIVLGLIQDGLSSIHTLILPLGAASDPFAQEVVFNYPSHIVSLTIVGILTARIQKQRYIQEDFISIALIVFGMAVVAETVTALQYSLQSAREVSAVWADHQRIALSSAILSSLWAPVVYYPLNRWWEFLSDLDQAN